MEESIYYFLVYYFGGILTYRVVMGAFTVSENSVFFREIETSVLKIYRALDYDMKATMKMKYLTMKEVGAPDEYIIKIAKKDQELLTTWRRSAINNMLNKTPSSVVRLNRYKTWNEAMNALKKEEKI